MWRLWGKVGCRRAPARLVWRRRRRNEGRLNGEIVGWQGGWIEGGTF
jgi:hypothetical protein